MERGGARLGATIAAFGFALALPALASAGNVALKGHRLEVRAGPGKNQLLIQRDSGSFVVTERNGEQGLRASGGCEAARAAKPGTSVSCPSSGIHEITVATGGGNDRVVVGREWPESRSDRNGCRGSNVGVPLDASLGAGRDSAELGDDDDTLRGGAGHDLLLGCGGDDSIAGGAGGDRVSGDRGDDELEGQGGPDTVIGCSYDPDDVNYPREESGDDSLQGGGGGDFLYGCNGTDTYAAGGGRDYLNALDHNAETANCGGGDPDVIYADAGDAKPGCEVWTSCTTDDFPIGPDSGEPSCFTPLRRPVG